MRSAFITLGVLIFLASLGIAAVSPTTTSLSPLFPLKKGIEAALLALAAPEDKAVVQASELKHRAVELNALKLQIAALGGGGDPAVVKKLQDAADATSAIARQTLAEVKANTQFMTDESKKAVILGDVDASIRELGEVKETPGPEESPE